jgi:hypothetical protein
MKTERISILGSPEFKAYLAREAEREGVSMSELVRRRCERAPTEDEAMLMSMAQELRQSVALARRTLEEGLLALRQTLVDLANTPGEHQARATPMLQDEPQEKAA